MTTIQIRRLNPLNTQIGLRREDAKYIQEVLYYCDSRMRAAMCRVNALPKHREHKIRMYLIEAVAMELVSGHINCDVT